jgi:hypothetical protein
MGKFIKDNIHWIVIIVGVVAILAYTKATAKDDEKKDSGKTPVQESNGNK